MLDPNVKSALSCASPMPNASLGVNSTVNTEEKACFRAWAEQLIAEKKKPPVDECATYEDVAPHAYVAKVKNLLTGEAPTQQELAAVQADPKALSQLIDTWMTGPTASKFDQKLLQFFNLAFQQTDATVETLDENWVTASGQWGRVADANNRVRDVLANNIVESFGRTALAIVKEGRPFTEVVTTRRFQMTTGMIAALSYNYDRRVNDKAGGGQSYKTLGTYIKTDDVVYVKNATIPLADSFNPNSPNWMRFAHPSMNACLTAATGNPYDNDVRNAWRAFTGTYWINTTRDAGIVNNPSKCRTDMRNHNGMLSLADFQDWRWVTVREPQGNEETTKFFKLSTYRGKNVFITDTPMVGFFSTPGFWATWQTNEDNQARVTINQTLIVAFGRSFDGEDNLVPASTGGLLDAQHAAPGSECWACHKTMDPMKQLIRQSLTYTGHLQLDTKVSGVSGVFAYYGVEKPGNGIGDLGKFISEHPDFAPAWVQKLCSYANSQRCNAEDPLFKQIVANFVASNYDFRALIKELYSSPLITGAKCTPKTTADTPSVARRTHFCSTLKNRLGINDLCRMTYFGADQYGTLQTKVDRTVSMLPADGFARGAARLVTIRESNLFVSQTYESICMAAAEQLVDLSGSDYQSSNVDGSIKNLVEKLAGLPTNDPRHASMITILRDHFDEALKQPNINAKTAFQSTFMIACLSPSVTGVGF
ncbi:MAG: DUF1585 domain-containing protein [Myxococcales bacterium]|nr:DUF1585 domain-containing protein [Myxococcales bacterium]